MYRDGVAYGLWCLFFAGLAGVHRIYLGKYGTGVLWLLTFGLFGVGQFVDLFRMGRLVRNANVREGHLPHPRWEHLAGDRADAAGRRTLSADAPSAGDASAEPARETTMQKLLAAAEENGGYISVTQGVSATGLSFEEVEETLRDMVASGYVDVDNHPDSGVVIYRFTELS